ncbi:MAG: DUF1015 domain-containing protein [Chloroflexota bacterium]|nr:DUF1015 domain-containing protein [Chloroflexota bacterium]
MAEVRPFNGLRYDTEVAGDPARLLCPPYDLIGPDQQREMAERSPYNAVHIELPSDAAGQDRYARARETYQRWLSDGAIVREQHPAYYLLRQRYTHRGAEHARLALFAAVRLEEFDKGVVLPHEQTTPAPKADRLALMEACHANFSPIMSLYRDRDGAVRRLLDEVASTPPALSAPDHDGHPCNLWPIADATKVRAIERALAPQPLYIADGHHRYETSLAYRDLARQRSRAGGTATAREAFNYVMMALIEFSDPGLIVLPYHRLLTGIGAPQITRVRDRLLALFDLERVPYAYGGIGRLQALVEDRGRSGTALGLVGPDGEGPYLLTLKKGVDMPGLGPLAPFEAWLLESQVLRPALGDGFAQHVQYVHDATQAAERTRHGEAQMAFILKPVSMELFERVVGQGQRLPPKSTYFWPKLPTGLVFNSLDGEI